MNRFTYDVAEFSPVNHEDHLVIHNQGNQILIQGEDEKVMEHGSFLIEKNRSLKVYSYAKTNNVTTLCMLSH